MPFIKKTSDTKCWKYILLPNNLTRLYMFELKLIKETRINSLFNSFDFENYYIWNFNIAIMGCQICRP